MPLGIDQNTLIKGMEYQIREGLDREVEKRLKEVESQLRTEASKIIAGITVTLMENISFERVGRDLIIRIQNFNSDHHKDLPPESSGGTYSPRSQ